MDLVSSGRAAERGKPSPSTPVKAFPPGAAAGAATKSSIPEEIVTPEKPAELPRRIRNRGVAFSVKQVRKIAASLQQSHGVSPDRTEKSRALRFAEKDTDLGSPPDNVQKRLPSKPVPKLTETCEILLEFFNALTSSIRLLRLKGHLSSFSKISPQVESLTNRRFSHGHLAQLKHILPEAICIKKILTHDEPTSCMKPDLQVVLQIDAFADGNEQNKGSGYHKLSQVFRSRLVQFSKDHPDGEDVPGAELPEPFNQTRGSVPSPSARNSIPESASCRDRPVMVISSSSQEQPAAQVPSHMPGSFRKHFSRKDYLCGEATPQLQAPESRQPGDGESSTAPAPALKSCARPTRARLFHSPVKQVEPKEEETEAADESFLKFLPKSLLQSVREKERRTREEQEAGMTASKRRRKMLSGLPKLFNTVLLLFQSAGCSVITRQELIHKIISSQHEIVDRREVEEQLGLLQELVPDWISGKTASSGDFLFCVNKTLDTDALRRRLAEVE